MIRLVPALETMHNLGPSIREKLDKRGFHGHLDVEDLLKDWTTNRVRVDNEIIGPMLKFIHAFRAATPLCHKCKKDSVWVDKDGKHSCQEHGV